MDLQTLVTFFKLYLSKRTRWSCLQRFVWARPILSRAMHKHSHGLDSQFSYIMPGKWFFYIFSKTLKPVIKKIYFKSFQNKLWTRSTLCWLFRMFFLRLHFQNYGTVGIGEPMGIRVLSGVHCLEVLSFCFRCAMKIPVQSRHALIISGCDKLNLSDHKV